MKEFLKSFVRLFASIGMLPLFSAYFLAAKLCGAESVFPGFSQFVSLFPGTTGVYLRRAFYQFALGSCDKNAYISFGTVFSHPGVTLGKTVYVGVGCMVGDAELQDDVLIGSHVSVINGSRQHGIDRLDLPVREQPGEYPRITIGQDAWIGDRAIVMANVGMHCVVGAGSVVTKPLDDYSIAVGNPARVIGTRAQISQDDVELIESTGEAAPLLS